MKWYSWMLLPLAGLFGVVMRLRAWLYARGWKKSFAVDVPVISVGNITVGGTGKTPMAVFLLHELQQMGARPAYLSRGYGRSTRGYLRVDASARDGMRYGDEAMLIAGRFPALPVVVCEDRVAGARRILAETDANVLILDDAFQHQRIRRDLDLVMVDGSRPPLRDFMLPAGRLREPRSALGRAQALVLGKLPAHISPQGLLDELAAKFPQALICHFELRQSLLRPFFERADRPAIPIESLQGKPCVAFSGLGNNAYFESQLRGAGMELLAFVGFPDHHVYSESEFLKILEMQRRHTEINGKFGAVAILSTEKDYQRLRSNAWLDAFQDIPLYYVCVEMQPVLGWEMLRRQIHLLLEK